MGLGVLEGEVCSGFSGFEEGVEDAPVCDERSEGNDGSHEEGENGLPGPGVGQGGFRDDEPIEEKENPVKGSADSHAEAPSEAILQGHREEEKDKEGPAFPGSNGADTVEGSAEEAGHGRKYRGGGGEFPGGAVRISPGEG